MSSSRYATFLHGSDGTNIRPVIDADENVERAPATLVDALSSGPYASILIAPQLEQGSWSSLDNDRIIREAIDSVQTTFKTDPQRRYLTGLSFGGFGTFAVGLLTLAMAAQQRSSRRGAKKGGVSLSPRSFPV